MKLINIQTLSFMLLAIAIAATAQNPVRDTSGKPLRRGVEYYIKPAITDNGGRFTLINRNGSCPLYVGQENTSAGRGLPVTFAPFVAEEKIVRETRDFKVSFAAATICVQSTTWKLDGELIGTGDDEGYDNYFYISPGEVENTYVIGWCPNDACPGCRWLRCGQIGAIVEDGKRLLVWAGRSVLPVVFERARY
ncbi:Endogenous alpha-amylase/subtilisin inhibitor [Morus notabilis]|uniref:Endogenous alpha-amylase/subtilisin inhibitor n=1 Tax=Morus notabilis TaxID=981085 RepID=W9RVA3_9ROSA|nr:endogenous alpha-amylase/subtilisin inhibitor [Morus notabilis]AUR26482.1 kunitz-type serine protease inhibitor [Morus notabilis]EXB74711.1 Endogenous alpha-amylase/subtilisin inhibitor [Morus notabilis]